MSRVIDLDSSSFDRLLRSTRKKIFVDFWAPWCQPCRKMNPLIEKVADKHDSIVFARVNIDEDADIAQRYHVNSIPTYVIFKDANPADSRVGAMSESQLEELISSHAAR